jgi:predicted ATPase/DNA-binding SARP family transcriptional activator
LEVHAAGRRVEVGGARLRALLTLLALETGRVVPVERLIDDLWEDRPPVGAPNALQSLVSRLRAALVNGHEIIESHPAGYRLTLAPGDVDAHDFEAMVVRARRAGDPAATAAELRTALALWRGPALADVRGAPFAEGPIARLEALRQAAIEERVEADLALGRQAELIPELEALTAADPLREPLRGQLMRALYAAGRQADALAVFTATKRALAEALGVDPSPELDRVHLAVLRRDPGLVPAAVPGGGHAEPARPCTNIRARLTSFIGRDEELKRVAKLLGEGRLVTLTGPGGAGKTRLATESAARLADRMPDGVWIVELAPVTDPAEVPQTVLSVLGLREVTLLTQGRPPASRPEVADPVDRLSEALAGKRMLLLLDNCEHLIDAVAALADRLLADAPGVRILATSREPLGITGETLWQVDPLDLPPEDASAEVVTTYPAVRLFADRAAAVRPGFAVTAGNTAHVVRICRALDGMPLAIELAAARMRALTPEQVSARLGDRFRLLTAGSRTALPRHQTLRAVVEWSWDLLDDAERALWRRLSIFAGGATVESAEAICAGTPAGAGPVPGGDADLPATDILDVLTALVDKSLVVTVDDGDGEPRYRMLETIRAYGLERLIEAGEEERARRAHAGYFLRLAEAAEPELRGRDQMHWLGRLAAEHDNLHTAVRWAISAGDARLAVRFCAALGWYWWLRGHRAEGGEVAAAAQALPGLPEDQSTALALAMAAFGSFGGPRDVHEVMGWLLRAREICDAQRGPLRHPLLRMLGPITDMFEAHLHPSALGGLAPMLADPDPWLRAFAHLMHGQADLNVGRAEDADAHFGAALAEFGASGDRWGRSFALMAQAEIMAWRGEHRRAIASYDEARTLLAQLGTSEDAPQAYIRLAGQLWLIGDHDRARELLTEALRIAERTGAPEGLAGVHFQLGELARWEGCRAEARRHMDQAMTLINEFAGPPHFRALIASGLGHLDAGDGDVTRAGARHAEALKDAVSVMDAPIIAHVLVGFADLAERRGDLGGVAELLGACHGIRGMPDRSQPDAVRLDERARTALGAEAAASAHERGQTMTLDDVLARLGIDRPPPVDLWDRKGTRRRS